MKWVYRKDENFLPFLRQRYQTYIDQHYNPLFAQILTLRDIEPEEVQRILKNPKSLLEKPSKIPGCVEAADRIIDAIDTKKQIYVYADYDVDGLTSGYIMTMFLISLGAKPKVHYPERKEGYGLSLEYVKTLPKGSVVITVDNGITAFDAIDYCNENGIEVIITDHHEPKDHLPKCVICDPWLDSEGYGHHLCGAVVAWKVCQSIQEITGKGDIDSFLPYTAIGTIADVMPMVIENQAIVRLGLDMITEESTPNLWELMKAYKLHDLSTVDIAWRIAPILNACSRLGNVRLAAELLFHSGSKEQLRKLIMDMDKLNERRKQETTRAVEEIKDIDYSDDLICLFDASDYPAGIGGIIANKIAEMYNKVAVVYSKGKGNTLTASVRSPDINILPFFEKEKQLGHIIDYGGHSNACGLTLLQSTDKFRESMNKQLAEVPVKYIEPTITIDAEITFQDLTKQNFIQFNKLASDRFIFPEPKFVMKEVKVADIKLSSNNPDNIQFTLVDKNKELKQIWAWRLGNRYEELGRPKFIDLVGTMTWGFGNASDKVTLNVEDIKCSY